MPDRSAARCFRLRLHGVAAVTLSDGRVLALERRAAALLALAAREPGISRLRVASMLWPDSGDPRRNLRQQLLRFRQLFGHPLVEGDAALTLGAQVLESPGDDASPLLAGHDYEDCEDFDTWLQAQRGAERARRAKAFETAIAQAEAEHRLDDAIACAEQQVAVDPSAEAHHRVLIRLHYLNQDVSRARAAFRALQRRLEEDFGVGPSAETLALMRLVEEGSAAASAPLRVTATALQRPPRMVGRATELHALRQALAERRALLLLGEAGIGKSRLLAEALDSGSGDVVVKAHAGDAAVPYATLTRLLRSLLERQRLQTGPGALVRLLPELVPIESPSGVPLRAAGDRLAMQAAVEQLIVQAELRAVAVDDLHFADEASLEMLTSLVSAEALADMSWIFTQRPGEGAAAAEALRDALGAARRLDEAEVRPLDTSQMVELVQSLQLPQLDAQRVGPQMLRHTGGNPLFALETLKQMLLAGETGPQLPQPATVGTLIDRRIRLLGPTALTLARVAAIAGPDFDTVLAEGVLGRPAIELADAWAELQQAQVLRESALAHDLVAEAVRQGVPAPIARHLHAQIAGWLGARDAEPARTAQHWLAAERDAEAIDALCAASRRARDTGRMAEAGRFLLQAARACDRLGRADRAFDLMYEAAEAMSLAVPMHEFEPIARELGQRARSDAQQAAAGLCHLVILIEGPDLAAAAQPIERALQAARRAGRRDLEAELTFGQVHLRHADRDFEGACDLMESALDLLRAQGMHASAAEKLVSLAVLQERVGRASEANRTYAQAWLEVEALSLHHMAPVLLSSWALNDLLAGDGEGTRQRLAQIEALMTERGDVEINNAHVAQCLNQRGLALLRLGEVDRALSLLLEAQRAPAWTRIALDPPALALVGAVMTELGRPERARAALDPLLQRRDFSLDGVLAQQLTLPFAPREAARFWDETPDLARTIPAVAARCTSLALLAEHAPPARALSELDVFIERGRAQAWHGAVIPMLAARAAVRARSGMHVQALEDAAAAASMAERHAAVVAPTWIALKCAGAFELAGDPARAGRCLQRAEAMVRSTAARLPDEFRASYLQRNPVVRAIVEAAQRSAA